MRFCHFVLLFLSQVASFSPVETCFCSQFMKLGLILAFLKIAHSFDQKCGRNQLQWEGECSRFQSQPVTQSLLQTVG